MIKLLDDTDDAINLVKTNQIISADSVINNAKKEAMTATAAARKKDKNAEEAEPIITKREEAKREAEQQNITNQTIIADSVINKAKKDAMTATAAAKKKDKSAEDVEPTIRKREDAKCEAERQNITNQTLVGTKQEGIIEILKRLVGGTILDTVTKTADAIRDKIIDNHQ